MIAPSYWVDPKSGNDYMLTVQYPGEPDPQPARPARHPAALPRALKDPTQLDAVTRITPLKSPTEIDHYQIQRVIDIYVNPAGEDLGTARQRHPTASSPARRCRPASASRLRGMVQGMQASFRSFGLGPDPRARAALPDSGRAVPVVHRSAADSAGGAARADRRAAGAVSHRHDAQRAVADGRA